VSRHTEKNSGTCFGISYLFIFPLLVIANVLTVQRMKYHAAGSPAFVQSLLMNSSVKWFRQSNKTE
jgi:hypothetical protein